MEIASIKKSSILVEIGIATAGSCTLALLSQLAIPMPPIPITLQTLGIFLLGGYLGSRRAFYSVLAYLIQGTCGLPVFAGGVANPLWFCSPQAGFLLSFLAAAYLIGKCIEKRPKPSLFYLLTVVTLGQIVIFLGGGIWLGLLLGWKKAYLVGIAPFFVGASLKIVSAALALKFCK
jgi:biotin transport system substrate-specific component